TQNQAARRPQYPRGCGRYFGGALQRARAMSSAQRYPLSWPENWKRTPARDRARAAFSRSTSSENLVEEWRNGQKVSVVRRTAHTTRLGASDAADRLERQLEALGASDAILSTNQ